MPHYMFCPGQKNNFQDFQNQTYIGIFMSQRGRARVRARARARAGKRKGKRKGKGQGEELARERERESANVLEIHF